MAKVIERFEGFSKELSEFFIELRFNNTKEWMNSNRDRYFTLLKEPTESFAKDISDELFALTGEKITYSISRINRDIRYSKNKDPYRDRRWVVFKKLDGKWKSQAVVYYEMGADYYEIGMGMYDVTPDYLKAFRKKIDSNTAEFERLIENFDMEVFQLYGEKYKKPFSGERSELVNEWYCRKDVGIGYRKEIDESVLSREILDKCIKEFINFMPLVDYLNDISY